MISLIGCFSITKADSTILAERIRIQSTFVQCDCDHDDPTIFSHPCGIVACAPDTLACWSNNVTTNKSSRIHFRIARCMCIVTRHNTAEYEYVDASEKSRLVWPTEHLEKCIALDPRGLAVPLRHKQFGMHSVQNDFGFAHRRTQPRPPGAAPGATAAQAVACGGIRPRRWPLDAFPS